MEKSKTKILIEFHAMRYERGKKRKIKFDYQTAGDATNKFLNLCYKFGDFFKKKIIFFPFGFDMHAFHAYHYFAVSSL